MCIRDSIDTVETAQANAQSLSEMMVGGRVDLNIDRPEPENVRKRLAVKGLNLSLIHIYSGGCS